MRADRNQFVRVMDYEQMNFEVTLDEADDVSVELGHVDKEEIFIEGTLTGKGMSRVIAHMPAWSNLPEQDRKVLAVLLSAMPELMEVYHEGLITSHKNENFAEALASARDKMFAGFDELGVDCNDSL